MDLASAGSKPILPGYTDLSMNYCCGWWAAPSILANHSGYSGWYDWKSKAHNSACLKAEILNLRPFTLVTQHNHIGAIDTTPWFKHDFIKKKGIHDTKWVRSSTSTTPWAKPALSLARAGCGSMHKFTSAIWTILESEILLLYCCKCIICLLYFQTKALCSRQHMTCRWCKWYWAVLSHTLDRGQRGLLRPRWPRVNTLSCTQPRHFC